MCGISGMTVGTLRLLRGCQRDRSVTRFMNRQQGALSKNSPLRQMRACCRNGQRAADRLTTNPSRWPPASRRSERAGLRRLCGQSRRLSRACTEETSPLSSRPREVCIAASSGRTSTSIVRLSKLTFGSKRQTTKATRTRKARTMLSSPSRRPILHGALLTSHHGRSPSRAEGRVADPSGWFDPLFPKRNLGCPVLRAFLRRAEVGMLAQPNGQELGSRVSIPALERAKDGASEILKVERRSKAKAR